MRRGPLDVTQALGLLQGLVERNVREEDFDLSQRQMAVLLIVYLEPPPHTVRALAARLEVTKPVITRALDTMGRAGLVTRYRDPMDRRNVLIRRTVEGAELVDRIGRRVAQQAGEVLHGV